MSDKKASVVFVSVLVLNLYIQASYFSLEWALNSTSYCISIESCKDMIVNCIIALFHLKYILDICALQLLKFLFYILHSSGFI